MSKSSAFFNKLLSEMAQIPEVDPELLKEGLSRGDFESGMMLPGFYVLSRKLGEGGFGEVWLGTDTKSGRPVAIKSSLKRGFAPRIRQRFEMEITSLARLDHESIVQILDEGQDAETGRRFFIMEHVEGEPLSGGPELPVLLGAFEGLLEGLAHAHARGMVHRDLKPSNVFFEADRRQLKILDFGIAHTDGHHTLEGEAPEHGVLGTPVYMSPEQAEGMSASVGPASDLYSVGVMLYEALSGHPPFRGSTLRLCFQHVSRSPEPLALLPQYRHEDPAPLSALCNDLLAKKYSDRPEFAVDVSARLREIIGGLETGAKPQMPRISFEVRGGPHMTLDTGPTLAMPDDLEGAFFEDAMGSWRLPFLKDPSPCGRDDEFRSLMSLASLVHAQQRPAMATISGPPGVGKSRLVRWVGEALLQRGQSRVMRLDLNGHAGLATALQAALYRHMRLPLLEPSALRDRVAETMAFEEGGATERFVTFMLRSAALSHDPGDTRWHAIGHEALARVIAHPRSRPLLLWVEAGSGSSEVLRRAVHWLTSFLVSRPGEPLLIIWDGATVEGLSDLAQLAPGTSIHLEPLPETLGRRFAEQLVPALSAEGLGMVSRWCEGNPLFIRELLMSWWTSGALATDETGGLSETLVDVVPQVLSDIYSDRLDGLLATKRHPNRAAWALCVLAWLGRGLSHRMLLWAMEGSDLTPEEVLLQDWFSQSTSWEAHYSFKTEVLRQILIERSQALDLSVDHIHEGLEFLLRNSLATMIRSDWNSAQTDLQRGWHLLEEQPAAQTPVLHLRLLNASALIHYRQRDAEGVALISERLRGLGDATMPRLSAAARLWEGGAALLRSEFEVAEQHLEQAASQAAHCQDAYLEALSRHLLGRLGLMRWSFETATDNLKTCTRLLRQTQNKSASRYVRDLATLTEADARCDLAEGRSLQGQQEAALELLADAIGLYEAMEDLHGQAYAALQVTRVKRRALEASDAGLSAEDQSDLKLHLRHARSLMERLNDRRGHALLAWESASLYSLQGRRQRAFDDFETAGQLFVIAKDAHGEALCINCCGEEARHMGRLQEALGLYQRFYQAMEAMQNAQGMSLARTNRAWVFLQADRPEEARAEFVAALSGLEDTAPDSERCIPRVGLALAEVLRDKPESAKVWLDEAVLYIAGAPLSDPDALLALDRLLGIARGRGWDDLLAACAHLKKV